MQLFAATFSSSSTSSPSCSSPKSSTSSSNKLSFKEEITNFFRKSKIARRISRHRKLVDLPDIEVRRSPVRDFGRDGGGGGGSDDLYSTRSSPGVPQPLPLPELAQFSRDSPSTSTSLSARLPLPAQKNRVYAESAFGDEQGGDVAGFGRNFTYRTIPKSPERADAQSIKSPINRGKKVFQDRNGFDSVQKNLWLNASSAMSAPGSGVSSPSHSPRRMSTGELFFSPSVPTQRFAWSSPEMSSMDISMDPFIQAFSDKIWPFPDRSPRQGHGMHSRSPSGASSPLHQESNGHTNVHPLPLPPGPSLSSHSMSTHQTITKPDVSTMTSQWQKGKLIGRGTFGSVYVGTNRETGALCAMKEVDLIPDDPKSAECMKQLEQEIKLLSQLKHPNIVQYYGSEIVGDHFYIYLEFVHPGSINKYVREHCGAITESVVRSFTRHILHGLAYLHSTKTVHRDIKGANLLVDGSGVVKLADFGMAKHLTGQTTELSMKGSPYWMAPEIINAVNQKDTNGDFACAVDIWSLGCTIIEIVNGKPPWSEFEGAAAMFKAWKETPPIPESLSPLGKDFLQCCFRRNPAERPTATQLLEHPFLKNSYQTERQASTRSFSGLKLGPTSTTVYS